MSLNSIDDHPSGRQYSCIHNIDMIRMIQRDAHQTTRREHEDAQENKTVVIALPAINIKQQIEDEKKRKRKHETESENEKESEEEEEECEHWSHGFAQQLIEVNEGGMPPQDQQIDMISNPFFKDLLQL